MVSPHARFLQTILVFIPIILASIAAPCADNKTPAGITDKTLVVWVALANTSQRGGSALTMDNQDGNFDGIVFGEVAPGRWMAGSNFLRRTQHGQDGNPLENSNADTQVQIAAVYHGNQITIYRNGEVYADYTIDNVQEFGEECVVVMGLRHLGASDRACLAGAIDDARIYPRVLSAEQIAKLKPNEASEPAPWAWWTFEGGAANDRMGTYPQSLLIGNTKVVDGKLVLSGRDSFLVGLHKHQADRWLAQQSSNELVPQVRKHRAALLDDRHRPLYHFVTSEGYCMPFDPNGAIYWKGKYHLCFIFQDERGHCWGHASSIDLIHWRFHTPALFPAPGDPDRGIFSGNAFVSKDGQAVMLYHGVDAGNCIATSAEDNLDRWTKLPSNPIVPIPKEGEADYGKYQSWDPHGWLEGDTYYAIFGGNPPTLFKSADMVKWEFVHKFLSADMEGVDADEDISCPDFFPIGDKHMLLCISHKRGCRYYLGKWENETFYPETHARMNWAGGTCFAPESLLDDKGRRIMWAWVLDRRPESEIRRSGWSGTMTLPRVLSLGDDGTLRIEPVEELSALRMNHRQLSNIEVAADKEVSLEDISGDSLELALDIEPGKAQAFGLKVRCSPDDQEQTSIAYDAEKKCIRIDVSHSTLDSSIKYRECCMFGGDNPVVTAQEAPFELKPGEPLHLRVFLDRSILEVFANDRQCVTQHIYPTREDSVGISLFSQGDSVKVSTLDAWKMAPANPW